MCGQSSALPLHLLVLLVALPDAVLLQQPLVLLLSGQKIIRNARIKHVGKSEPCMVYRHSASVASNFEALQKLAARVDDADRDRTEMKNVRKDLFKIFNPQGPVFNAGVSLTSGNVPGVSDTEDD